MHVLQGIGRALYMAFAMFWEILWALCLGFFISGVVQAVVSKSQIAQILGDDRPGTIATACWLGAASSACSYAAVAIARALFRKGANFTAAVAFELGSTNLVAELGVIMVPSYSAGSSPWPNSWALHLWSQSWPCCFEYL